MRRSTERILTTHTGSLPRPRELAGEHLAGRGTDRSNRALIDRAVSEAARQQVSCGIDIISDGEMSKDSFATYVHDRLSGFEGESESAAAMADLADYPTFFRRWADLWGKNVGSTLAPPACVDEIGIKNRELLHADLDALHAATTDANVVDIFMPAASPGVIATYFANHHYSTREAFLQALASAMKEEYEAIVNAGFVLQLDCPDLAMSRHLQFSGTSVQEFRRQANLDIEALNDATADIDPDRMRLHLCWGNYEGPHHRDVPLADIIDIALRARPNALLVEAANPRHEHEWELFETVTIPDDTVLIPGVIDSTMNYIEHPQLIAQRIARYARLVGQDRVMAGSDCGFGSTAGTPFVEPEIVWEKFRALSEGAQRATKMLTSRTQFSR